MNHHGKESNGREESDSIPAAEPHGRSTRKPRATALVGALLGMTALAGTLVGASAIAGAQDDPGTTPPAAEETETDPPETEAADWLPFEECITDQTDDLEDPWIDGHEPTNDELAALEAAWEAAEEACIDLLPAEAKAELEAWNAFDQCLTDSGAIDEAIGAGTVHVETGDGYQMIEFGETEGSVTISGTVDDLTITSEGAVTVLDDAALEARWAEIDAAHAACEELLPEDAFGDEFLGDFEVEVEATPETPDTPDAPDTDS